MRAGFRRSGPARPNRPFDVRRSLYPSSLIATNPHMAVVGSTITIDIHFTADTDADSVRGAMRSNRSLHPDLETEIRQMVDTRIADVFSENDIDNVVSSVDLELIDDRVPGAPRERITGSLTVEGDETDLAGVDSAIDPPARADLADAAEELIVDYLERQNLHEELNITVSVTPVEFQ